MAGIQSSIGLITGVPIVDTGFESAERTIAVHGQQVWRSKDQEPEKLLRDRGVDLESIRTVIVCPMKCATFNCI